MARYVVLSFEDNTKAETFISDKLVLGPDLQDLFAGTLLGEAKVEAIFAKPTKFCECTKKRKGWFRGKKYGWWVCSNCGLPTANGGDLTRLQAIIGQGKDLLTNKDAPREHTVRG